MNSGSPILEHWVWLKGEATWARKERGAGGPVSKMMKQNACNLKTAKIKNDKHLMQFFGGRTCDRKQLFVAAGFEEKFCGSRVPKKKSK